MYQNLGNVQQKLGTIRQKKNSKVIVSLTCLQSSDTGHKTAVYIICLMVQHLVCPPLNKS